MGSLHTDLFATKGLEYLLVITYLVLLAGFWTLLSRAPVRKTAVARSGASSRRHGWFSLPESLHFHQGHTWAVKEAHGVLRVGMDEFSRRLLGSPFAIRLPEVGHQLEQGEIGWTVMVEGEAIEMVSPVNGEVLAVNPRALATPEGVLERPYDDGWLLKVRVNPEKCPLRNLLSGELARAWIQHAEERIRTLHTGDLGVALPDGGRPVDGFARALSPGGWGDLAREILLVDRC